MVVVFKLLCKLEGAFHYFASCFPAPVRKTSTRIIAWAAGSVPHTARFNTDSFRIGVDTHASRTLSPCRENFQDLKLTPNLVYEGFNDKKGAGATIAGIGTFVFTIEDDEGQYHPIELPNSLYIPSAKGVLLCPQH